MRSRIFISLHYLQLGSSTVIPFGKTVIWLIFTVLAPLLCGQLLQSIGLCKSSNIPAAFIGQSCLLLIIFATFCDVFYYNEAVLHPLDILFTVLLGKFIIS